MAMGKNRLLTTPSGLCKGEVEPGQLVITDLSGKKISGNIAIVKSGSIIQVGKRRFAKVINTDTLIE